MCRSSGASLVMSSSSSSGWAFGAWTHCLMSRLSTTGRLLLLLQPSLTVHSPCWCRRLRRLPRRRPSSTCRLLRVLSTRIHFASAGPLCHGPARVRGVRLCGPPDSASCTVACASRCTASTDTAVCSLGSLLLFCREPRLCLRRRRTAVLLLFCREPRLCSSVGDYAAQLGLERSST